jgi:hypothetical protein
MTLTVPSGRAVDLCEELVDEVLERVEQVFRVRFDHDTVVRKRRTIGARTDRQTWVPIERRPCSRIGEQGWNGAECAALLDGVVQPVWHAAVSWRDMDDATVWRADETDLLPGEPVKPGGVLTEDPGLSDEWWAALNGSLDALPPRTPRGLLRRTR